MGSTHVGVGQNKSIVYHPMQEFLRAHLYPLLSVVSNIIIDKCYFYLLYSWQENEFNWYFTNAQDSLDNLTGQNVITWGGGGGGMV